MLGAQEGDGRVKFRLSHIYLIIDVFTHVLITHSSRGSVFRYYSSVLLHTYTHTHALGAVFRVGLMWYCSP